MKAAFHTYYPFGEEATAAGQSTLRLKLTGHERDFASDAGTADDLDYMWACDAHPLRGRFLSFDPLGGNPRHPQSWNRYAYVLGNPVSLVDPLGLFPIFYDEIIVSPSAMWRGIRFTSSPFTADRLYFSSRQFGALLNAAGGGPEPTPFAVAVAREVAYGTGWIAENFGACARPFLVRQRVSAAARHGFCGPPENSEGRIGTLRAKSVFGELPPRSARRRRILWAAVKICGPPPKSLAQLETLRAIIKICGAPSKNLSRRQNLRDATEFCDGF